MPDLVYQALIRLAVMLPTILIVTSLVWLVLRKFGAVTPGAVLEPSNMRTWPLSFLLADAALFAVVFAFVAAWLGEGEWTAPRPSSPSGSGRSSCGGSPPEGPRHPRALAPVQTKSAPVDDHTARIRV
jgi:hypothetical protein